MQKMMTPLSVAMTAIAMTMVVAADPALAYVGPGSSLGAVGVLLGLIGTILLSLLSFVWYPIRRLYRKLRRQDPARARIVSRRSGQP